MSKSIIPVHNIKRAEQRDLVREEKVVEYTGNEQIRFAYETDNNDVTYRGIEIVEFEKACLASRIDVLEELQNKKPEDYEDVIERFVMNLEFRLFEGLYMGDLEDLIEESDELVS